MDFELSTEQEAIRTAIASYSNAQSDYDMTLDFEVLDGTANAADLCVKARVVNAAGEATAFATWNCEAL